MQALDADCQSIQEREGVPIYDSHNVMSEGKSNQRQKVDHKTEVWLVSIACNDSQKPRKSVLQPTSLSSPDDSLEDLRPIGKLIRFFVESLLSQDHGKLAIGSHSRLILIYPRLVVFSLSITVPFLQCHFLITQSGHLFPIYHRQIDLSPGDICEESRAACLIAERHPIQPHMIQVCSSQIRSLHLSAIQVSLLQLRPPQVGSLQLGTHQADSLYLGIHQSGSLQVSFPQIGVLQQRLLKSGSLQLRSL